MQRKNNKKEKREKGGGSMIISLKKVTILSQEEAETTLKKLGAIGIMHIESALGRFRLPWYENILEKIAKARVILKDKTITNSYLNNNIEDDIERLQELLVKEDKFTERKKILLEEKQFYDLFGEINLNFIKVLEEKGEKLYFYIFDNEDVGNSMLAWHKIKGELCGITNCKIIVEKEENLPTLELSDIDFELKYISEELIFIDKEFQRIGNCLEAMEKYENQIKNIMLLKEKANATKQISQDMKVFITYGFIEEKNIIEIEKTAKNNGWAYLIEQSEPQDEPPVLLKNNKHVENIIYPIYDFMGSWPSPFGKDPSKIFAFFTIFFGSILIGDAGYGVSIIVAVFFLRKKMKFPFLYYLGIACVIWGSITGTWFGNSWLILNTPLKYMVIENFSSYNLNTGELNTDIQSSMGLMFIFGGFHLTMAKFLSFSNKIGKNVENIGDIFLIWGMVYAIRVLMAGETRVFLVVPLLISGLVFGVIGIIIEKEGIFSKLGKILLKPLSLVNGFADTMSYIRLFAVGFASLIVSMVGSLIAGMTGNIILGAVIMILMNTINLSLGMIAILVHAVRLNNLEFANNSGIELGSKKFNPFKVKI